MQAIITDIIQIANRGYCFSNVKSVAKIVEEISHIRRMKRRNIEFFIAIKGLESEFVHFVIQCLSGYS